MLGPGLGLGLGLELRLGLGLGLDIKLEQNPDLFLFSGDFWGARSTRDLETLLAHTGLIKTHILVYGLLLYDLRGLSYRGF